MTVLLNEDFTGSWTDKWGGKPHNAYSVGDGKVRILFRKGSHYGSDYRYDLEDRVRAGSLEYSLYLSGDWDPSWSGKLPGMFDTRYEPYGYGNNKPAPNGGSIRTWFGGPSNYRQVGLYVYHAGQQHTYGDHVVVAEVPLWRTVDVGIWWDMNSGWVRMKVSTGHEVLGEGELDDLSWGDDTAFDIAWLCGYHGGSKTSPSNMAADIDNFIVSKVDPIVDERAAIAEELRALADRVENL